MKKVIPSESQEEPAPKGIVARFPKEFVKSLLYLAAGKPDSNIKVFYDRILVEPSDLHQLNTRIQEKLQTHHLEGAIASINVTYETNEIDQFGTWAEFMSTNWNIAKVTESITLKWDFMVDMPAYELPQRHTVLVKIASPIPPWHFFRTLFSGDIEDVEEMDLRLANVVCRVDFINHLLSDELIHIVDGWIDALKKEPLPAPYVLKLKRHSATIRRIIHRSMPFFVSVVVLGALQRWVIGAHSAGDLLTVGLMRAFMLWLLGSYLGLGFAGVLGRYLGRAVERAIDSYGHYTMFRMTSGDTNKCQELQAKNRKIITRGIFHLVSSLAIEVAAAVVGAWLLR